MSKIQRIRARADFLKAARTGLCYKSGILLVQCRKRDSGCVRSGVQEGLRVGFTASKKVGNAVVRNRCKRRMRAAAELVFKDVTKENVDYVFIARRMMYSAEWSLILRTFKSAVSYLNKNIKRSSAI